MTSKHQKLPKIDKVPMNIKFEKVYEFRAKFDVLTILYT